MPLLLLETTVFRDDNDADAAKFVPVVAPTPTKACGEDDDDEDDGDDDDADETIFEVVAKLL